VDNDESNEIIACVTGASGMIGSKIVDLLLMRGYTVRILTRNQNYNKPGVEIVRGSLENEEALNKFLHDAALLFHCAGELSNESKMWEVNVSGTERILNLIPRSNITYFCYLSSAGVVGRTSARYVDENTACHPQNMYERSKWAAEQIVKRGSPGCHIVILRPTNVIAGENPGALSLPMRALLSDRLKMFLKGGECAHIIHAEDVASAAIHLIDRPINTPSCFFVSCDHERLNTFAGLWSLYRAIERGQPVEKIEPMMHLPMIVPYLLRKLLKGKGNLGNVRYSSEKLLSTGFCYPLGVEGAVQRIVSSKRRPA
jgi:nucleoside-diphosphate-sugar epimerase